MAAGGQLTTDLTWVERHTAAAPPVLGARVREYATAMPVGDALPHALAGAATHALLEVLRQPAGRAAALDLLAADALITLALLAQAQADPAHLGRFATALLQAEIARA